ncbi:MAG: HEAT repeat domain-containing protein [Vicinamibacterales bacterium]
MPIPPPLLLLLLLPLAPPVPAQAPRPFRDAEVDQLAHLLMLEDARQYDEDTLASLLDSPNPEVKRRAAMAVGRIADPRGIALLWRERGTAAISREIAFSFGQLKADTAIGWLESHLVTADGPEGDRVEAARSLGKIRTPEARAALERFLAAGAEPTAARGEALLSLGRFTTRGDLDVIRRWTRGNVPDFTWRAAWALYRPRDPEAVPDLLRLSRHPDPEVRFWAVRGLGALPPDRTPVVEAATLSARLREAVADPDRRVRTEALRALGTYDDDASFAVVLEALDSPDTWLSVSAAEAMSRFDARRDAIVPRLVAASDPTRPSALRVTALTPLVRFAPDRAIDLAAALTSDPSLVVRTSARQALANLGDAGVARLEALPVDPDVPNPSPRGAGAGRGRGGAGGGRAAAAGAGRAGGGGGRAGGAGRTGGGGGRGAAPPDTRGRTLDDYRRMARRWIVAPLEGAAPVRAIWETPRGTITIALHTADAPIAMEYLVHATASGDLVGTEFGRLVPNFVAQQRTIRDAWRLRDEVNLHGLTRGNLSWASSGLDTGRPGYTLGHTAQPHNEGDFTALGLVVDGLDVMDRLELGDAIVAARLEGPGFGSGGPDAVSGGSW